MRGNSAYWNPYVAGIALGLVLLSALVVAGRGLGASGAFSSVVTAGAIALEPGSVHQNPAYERYAGDATGGPLRDWLVFEILGVLAGGFLSAALAGRLRLGVERGPHARVPVRLFLALGGGVLMGFGAKLARGCTSGQALTGGALMSAGSWAFMAALFAGAYAFAWFVRREWR